jgi:hypothetical protein
MESSANIPPKRKSYTPFYRRWCDMRVRCEKPSHPLYKWYGARGITVCERWQSFDLFSEDMLSSWAPGLWLDRLDNSKGYSPENCKWVTPSENNRNRRYNRWIATPEGPMVLAEAAEKFGIEASRLRYRVNRGLSLERTFSKQDFRKKA